jgi:hypothetical protein
MPFIIFAQGTIQLSHYIQSRPVSSSQSATRTTTKNTTTDDLLDDPKPNNQQPTTETSGGAGLMYGLRVCVVGGGRGSWFPQLKGITVSLKIQIPILKNIYAPPPTPPQSADQNRLALRARLSISKRRWCGCAVWSLGTLSYAKSTIQCQDRRSQIPLPWYRSQKILRIRVMMLAAITKRYNPSRHQRGDKFDRIESIINKPQQTLLTAVKKPLHQDANVRQSLRAVETFCFCRWCVWGEPSSPLIFVASLMSIVSLLVWEIFAGYCLLRCYNNNRLTHCNAYLFCVGW